MHFAPQWVKPIKPAGPALTPTTETPPLAHHKVAPAAIPSSPFPALGQPRSGSPNHGSNGGQNQPLSYSRVTHTPASPSFGGEGYFPYSGADSQNGAGDPSPYPFRYSREQILAVWDEDKFKERPIELMQIAENGAVIVSKDVTKPVGLRELSELEKKVSDGVCAFERRVADMMQLLATSVHPPMPARRPQQQHGQHQSSDPQSRRGPTNSKDGLSPVQTSRSGFSGFGRGEGGAFGSSKFSGASEGHQGRQPGGVGGGFAGVPKRQPRQPRGDNSEESSRSTWRQARSAGSGGFEGVLGFGNSPTASASAHPDQPQGGGDPRQQDRQQPPEDDRWTQKNWRRAPEADKFTESDSAQPSDDLHQDAPSAIPESRTPVQEPRADLGSVNWLYRDPNGQEQGPFTGNQMHEWYSHSYFQDDLPIRRQNEGSFQTLAELKASTGNAVQPFLSPVRPRLPPNLPIASPALHQSAAPGAPSPSLNDSFGRLHLHPITPTSPFQQTATSPYYQPQFSVAPSYPQQQWNAAPGPRLNGMYGSIGPGAAQGYPAYGGAVNHQRSPDPFAAAPIGQSPWSAAAPAANNWQQPHQPQMPMQHAPTAQMPVQEQQAVPTQGSYFPEQEHTALSTPADLEEDSEAEAEFIDSALEGSLQASAEDKFKDRTEVYVDEDQEHDLEPDHVQEPDLQPSSSGPKQSAWATPTKPTTSRESSVSGPTPAQAAPSTLPPAHSSLPPKPVPAPESEPVTPVKPSTPKPAPWAAKTPASAGPSLREIQEAESRQAEARKQALAEARALASPAAAHSSSEDVTGTMSWGLPGQSLKSSNTGSSTPPGPAWGGASDGPKKTLKQIQEEEEKRKVKAEAHLRAAVATQKRGYADLAAHAVPTPAQVAAAAAQGWTTVGAAGKITAAPAKAAASPVAKSPVAVSKPAASPTVAVPKAIKANGTDDGPSIEFIRWTKQALQGITVPVDEFIAMLLQFPVDPPASARADQLEIIADSVYASSSTLDGRRFAQEFFTRRKQDVQRAASGRPVQKVTSIADVVKTQPKQAVSDVGFKVVKKKGKKA